MEKLYEQVNHLENPLTPNQVVLLKKVVNKFKSKVRTPIEEEKEVSPLLSSSRGSSPRQVSQHSLAIPLVSPVASSQANTRPRPTWGKFLRKTSEQMLGMNSQTKVGSKTSSGFNCNQEKKLISLVHYKQWFFSSPGAARCTRSNKD